MREQVTKLSVDHKMPLKQISQLFEDMYGYDLNSGTIEDALERAYELAEPIEAQIVEQLTETEVAHFDETGVRVAGKLHWLHVVFTDKLTHLFVHEKRGADALNAEASVLKDFTGTAIHDCWSSYFNFTQARHALCGAHLLRELQAQRGKRGKPKQSKGRKLLNRLRTHETGVLAFAFEAGVPFTNNQAERDLRPAKVKQKVSGCFRTKTGAEVYARLQAAVSTFRKQGLNVFASLRDLFAFSPAGLA